jgi:rRNA maturation RNase YbeY
MGRISFFSCEIPFNLRNRRVLRQWLFDTITTEKKAADDINIIFCSDDYLLGLNKQYLRHHTLTDIITFPGMAKPGGPISGELYISIDRVRDNAKKYSVSVQEELCRVMIHGILHLCGYGDKTPNEIKKMRTMETKYLQNLFA